MANTTEKKIVVGTRLEWGFYGRGIVYAIYGEVLRQDAVMCFAQDGAECGAKCDIVFDQGTISRDVPELFIRTQEWEIFDEVLSAEEIAVALMVAACSAASKSAAIAEQRAIYSAYNDEIARLRSAPEYHHIAQGDDKHSGRLAARNIRASIKSAFPELRCSVRRTTYGNVIVNWKDGPLPEQIEAIVQRYRAGRYNKIAGAYEYCRLPWVEVFGAAKYISAVREESDDLVEKAIAALFAKHPANLIGIDKPTASTYKGGGLCGIAVPGFDEDLQRLVRKEVASATL